MRNLYDFSRLTPDNINDVKLMFDLHKKYKNKFLRHCIDNADRYRFDTFNNEYEHSDFNFKSLSATFYFADECNESHISAIDFYDKDDNLIFTAPYEAVKEQLGL